MPFGWFKGKNKEAAPTVPIETAKGQIPQSPPNKDVIALDRARHDKREIPPFVYDYPLFATGQKESLIQTVLIVGKRATQAQIITPDQESLNEQEDDDEKNEEEKKTKLTESEIKKIEPKIGSAVAHLVIPSIATLSLRSKFRTNFTNDPISMLRDAEAPNAYVGLVSTLPRELAAELVIELFKKGLASIQEELSAPSLTQAQQKLKGYIGRIRQHNLSATGIVRGLYLNFRMPPPEEYNKPVLDNDLMLRPGTISRDEGQRYKKT